MDTITEQEFLDAIKIIRQYKTQVQTTTEELLNESGITKTPNEILYNWNEVFPTMSVRLWHILKFNFKDVRICDISKYEFFRARNAGQSSWNELSRLIGKEK